MKQESFSDIEYSNRRRKTRREIFLKTMDELIPWEAWFSMIRPYYYQHKRGRKPIRLEVMLRMYLLKEWFQLSDERIEEAVYDSYAMRSFLGINFMKEQVPAASTLLRFRHLLKKHSFDEKISADLDERLKNSGLVIRKTPFVDVSVTDTHFPEKQQRSGSKKQDFFHPTSE